MNDDTVPVWPACPLLQRLMECRIMLYQHGLLSWHEANKADQRIKTLAERLQHEAQNCHV